MQMGKTMEEKAFREHVSWVMFLLSILVIWAHSIMRSCFPARAPVTEGIWLTVHRIQDFLSAALGLTAVPGFFYAVGVPFFPQLFLGEASGKMEEPGPQRGGPLSGLESFFIIWAMCWQPAFRPFTGSLENRRCHLTGRSFWRLFFIISTRRYSGICIS